VQRRQARLHRAAQLGGAPLVFLGEVAQLLELRARMLARLCQQHRLQRRQVLPLRAAHARQLLAQLALERAGVVLQRQPQRREPGVELPCAVVAQQQPGEQQQVQRGQRQQRRERPIGHGGIVSGPPCPCRRNACAHALSRAPRD